ncbi:MAG: hypothetical protein V3V31_00840 [Methylococcales bacterium]
MQKFIVPCLSLYFIACQPAFSQADSNDIDLTCQRNAEETVNTMNQKMTPNQVESLRKKLFESCQQSFKSVIDPEKTEQQQTDLAKTRNTDAETREKSEMDPFTRFWFESNNQDKKGIKRMKRLK